MIAIYLSPIYLLLNLYILCDGHIYGWAHATVFSVLWDFDLYSQ